MNRYALVPLVLLLSACAQSLQHTEPGATAVASWFGPWQHRHTSRAGTPLVHPIGMEPAFLGRDLLLSYQRQEAPGESEDELAAEIEWALSGRLGVAIELPLVRVAESAAASRSGLGDLVVAPRAILIDGDDFLLAGSLGLTVATGDVGRGLGAGEATLAPGLTCWGDLGHGHTLQARIGTEHGLETGDITLDYHGSWIYTMAVGGHRDDHVGAGTTSLIAEFGGRTILDGPLQTRTTAEALLGISYALDGRWELRGGYRFPLGGPEDFDHGLVIGAILHL